MFEILGPFIYFSLSCRRCSFENCVLNWKWPYVPSVINSSKKEEDSSAANSHSWLSISVQTMSYSALWFPALDKLQQIQLYTKNYVLEVMSGKVAVIRVLSFFLLPFWYSPPCAILCASCVDLGHVELWVKKLLMVKHYCAWNLKKIDLMYMAVWKDSTSLFTWLSVMGYDSCRVAVMEIKGKIT